MAQNNFFDEDLDFGVETATAQDIHELEDFMTDTVPIQVDTKTLTKATEKDIEEEKEKSKTSTAEAKAQEKLRLAKEAKEKEAEEHSKFMEGEDKEETTEKPETSKSTEQDTEDDTEIPIEEIARGFFKLGQWTKDDNETDDNEEDYIPTTQEEFIQRSRYEDQKRAENLLYNFSGRFGEKHREAFEAMYIDGVNPSEYIAKDLEVTDFKEMDLSDEDSQERIVTAALKYQGWEDVDIKDEVKKLKLNSDLETTAARHHKALVKTQEAELVEMREQAKIRNEQKKQADEYKAKNIRTILSNKVKEGDFDGIPVNRDDIDKVLNLLEKPKWKLKSGELITDFQRIVMDLQNPQNHSALLQLALLFKGYDPEKPIALNLKPVAKKAVSKESNEVFQFQRNKKAKNSNVSDENKVSTTSQFLAGL